MTKHQGDNSEKNALEPTAPPGEIVVTPPSQQQQTDPVVPNAGLSTLYG